MNKINPERQVSQPLQVTVGMSLIFAVVTSVAVSAILYASCQAPSDIMRCVQGDVLPLVILDGMSMIIFGVSYALLKCRQNKIKHELEKIEQEKRDNAERLKAEKDAAEAQKNAAKAEQDAIENEMVKKLLDRWEKLRSPPVNPFPLYREEVAGPEPERLSGLEGKRSGGRKQESFPPSAADPVAPGIARVVKPIIIEKDPETALNDLFDQVRETIFGLWRAYGDNNSWGKEVPEQLKENHRLFKRVFQILIDPHKKMILENLELHTSSFRLTHEGLDLPRTEVQRLLITAYNYKNFEVVKKLLALLKDQAGDQVNYDLRCMETPRLAKIIIFQLLPIFNTLMKQTGIHTMFARASHLLFGLLSYEAHTPHSLSMGSLYNDLQDLEFESNLNRKSDAQATFLLEHGEEVDLRNEIFAQFDLDPANIKPQNVKLKGRREVSVFHLPVGFYPYVVELPRMEEGSNSGLENFVAGIVNGYRTPLDVVNSKFAYPWIVEKAKGFAVPELFKKLEYNLEARFRQVNDLPWELIHTEDGSKVAQIKKRVEEVIVSSKYKAETLDYDVKKFKEAQEEFAKLLEAVDEQYKKYCQDAIDLMDLFIQRPDNFLEELIKLKTKAESLIGNIIQKLIEDQEMWAARFVLKQMIDPLFYGFFYPGAFRERVTNVLEVHTRTLQDNLLTGIVDNLPRLLLENTPLPDVLCTLVSDYFGPSYIFIPTMARVVQEHLQRVNEGFLGKLPRLTLEQPKKPSGQRPEVKGDPEPQVPEPGDGKRSTAPRSSQAEQARLAALHEVGQD